MADALADHGTIGERLRAAERNTAAAAETPRLVTARYRGGIDSYLDHARRPAHPLPAQRNRVAVELAEALNRWRCIARWAPTI